MSQKLFCIHCGGENDGDSRFCQHCGKELEPLEIAAEATAEEAPAAATPAVDPQQAAWEAARAEGAWETASEEARQQATQELYDPFELEDDEAPKQEEAARQGAFYRDPALDEVYYQAPPRKKRRVWIPILLVFLLLALAAGGVFAYFYFFKTTTVDLTKNITMKDLGLEGYNGEALLYYEEEALRAKADYPRGNEKAEAFMESVHYEVEPAGPGLSNDDQVVVSALYSEETAKSKRIEVKGESKTLTISGLEDSPLEDLEESWKWLEDLLLGDEDAPLLAPDISSREYTEEDIKDLDEEQLQDIINEIYARHGYIFKDDDLRKYYESQSWYRGDESDQQVVEKRITGIEYKNYLLLRDRRDELKER